MLKMAAPLDFFDAARRAEAPSSGGWHTCSVFCIIPHLPSARKGFCTRRAGKFGALPSSGSPWAQGEPLGVLYHTASLICYAGCFNVRGGFPEGGGEARVCLKGKGLKRFQCHSSGKGGFRPLACIPMIAYTTRIFKPRGRFFAKK